MPRKRTNRAKLLGVSDEEYAERLQAQDGHCALCPSEPKTRRLHVDHDHKTGAVRGLLCFRCNFALKAWMTAAWLRRAADYTAGGTDHDQTQRSSGNGPALATGSAVARSDGGIELA